MIVVINNQEFFIADDKLKYDDKSKQYTFNFKDLIKHDDMLLNDELVSLQEQLAIINGVTDDDILTWGRENMPEIQQKGNTENRIAEITKIINA